MKLLYFKWMSLYAFCTFKLERDLRVFNIHLRVAQISECTGATQGYMMDCTKLYVLSVHLKGEKKLKGVVILHHQVFKLAICVTYFFYIQYIV